MLHHAKDCSFFRLKDVGWWPNFCPIDCPMARMIYWLKTTPVKTVESKKDCTLGIQT